MSSAWSMLPLFMVILLDVAGIILVMPVLTPLILHPDSGMVPVGTSLLLRDFLYGLSLALFPLFMFFATPVLGDLSDRFGRKKILLVCLLVSALSYLISALGVMLTSLFILLFSRALAGLAAGTQAIATAAIIDASSPEKKSINLAWVVFASSMGLILGPAVAAVTANPEVVNWFSYETPFFLAAGVCLLNTLLLYFTFNKDESVCSKDRVLSLLKGFTHFIAAFRQPKFRLLSLLYFCFIMSWALYYQTINWLFMERFAYGVERLGLFVAFLGLIFAIGTSVVVRLVLRFISNEITIFKVAVLCMGIANIAAAITHNELSQWLWAILNALGDVLCYTMALSIFSALATKESQGWIMGVSGSIAAMTWAIAALLVGILGYISITFPLWIAGGLCFLSFTLMFTYGSFKEKQ